MDIQAMRSPETVEFIDTLAQLTEIIRTSFSRRTPTLNGAQYLTNKHLCELLHISQRRLQDYRDEGRISYIQISGKILYKESDVLKLLEDNYVSSWQEFS